MYYRAFLFFQLFLMLNSKGLFAQNIPVGSMFDKEIRNLQLSGKFDSLVSFTIRPMVNNENFSPSHLFQLVDGKDSLTFLKPVHFAKGYGKLQLLPITITQQYNSHHPYGWNDAAMIASKGYQTLISAGMYTKIGPLEIKLQPEFVYAGNQAYESNVAYGSNPSGAYHKIFLGQSSIRVSAGPISMGISSENLWWGPGINSSLLMSNNAPGFFHAFMGSRKSIKTPIGNFEWQLIGAKLTSDNNLAYENFHLQSANLINDARYLNAIVVNYQPKWIPGLFLGITRGIQTYKNDLDKQELGMLEKYLPVLALGIQKKNVTNDDTLRRDQLASFFVRWVFAKSKAEFYIEYGFNDYGVSIRDYVMSPTHSAAYIVGFRKILPTHATASRMDIGMEITQMSQSPDYLVRPAGNWYEHSTVLQGYTNNNQILGAGAGMGCNVQTISATWVRGWHQLGLLLERVERDPVYKTYNWVDYGIGILPQWSFNKMILSAKFQFINSTNYAWESNVNRFNLHSRLSVQYLF